MFTSTNKRLILYIIRPSEDCDPWSYGDHTSLCPWDETTSYFNIYKCKKKKRIAFFFLIVKITAQFLFTKKQNKDEQRLESSMTVHLILICTQDMVWVIKGMQKTIQKERGRRVKKRRETVTMAGRIAEVHSWLPFK